MREFNRVSPKVWVDSKYRNLSDDGRLAHYWVQTNPAQNSSGAFRGSAASMSGEICWEYDRAQLAFEELTDANIIGTDPSANLVVVWGFVADQLPKAPGVATFVGNTLRELTDCDLKTSYIQSVTKILDESGKLSPSSHISYHNGLVGATKGTTGDHRETQRQRDTETKRKESVLSRDGVLDAGGNFVYLPEIRAALMRVHPNAKLFNNAATPELEKLVWDGGYSKEEVRDILVWMYTEEKPDINGFMWQKHIKTIACNTLCKEDESGTTVFDHIETKYSYREDLNSD